jgi:hemerythrin-like domain-containing protein
MTIPGTYDTATSDMFAVHQAITTALDSAPVLVDGTRDRVDRAKVIASFYENVLEFLHVHHAGEDELIYPILEKRCVEEKAMLERIDSQHALLNEPMEQARASLAAWGENPSREGAENVVQKLGTVDEILRPHLSEEEDLVLPVASAWLSPEEWGQLPGHALQAFQGDKPWLAVGLIREQLTSEEQDAMLSRMPLPVQTLWTEQWEPAFASFIIEVRA